MEYSYGWPVHNYCGYNIFMLGKTIPSAVRQQNTKRPHFIHILNSESTLQCMFKFE